MELLDDADDRDQPQQSLVLAGPPLDDPSARAADGTTSGAWQDDPNGVPPRPAPRRALRLSVVALVAVVVAATLGMYALGRRDGRDVALAAERARVVVLAVPGQNGAGWTVQDGPDGKHVVIELSLTLVDVGAPLTISDVRSPSSKVKILPLRPGRLRLARQQSVPLVLDVAIPCQLSDRGPAPKQATLHATDDHGVEHAVAIDLPAQLAQVFVSAPGCDADAPIAQATVVGWKHRAGTVGIEITLQLVNGAAREQMLQLSASGLDLHTDNNSHLFRVPGQATARVPVGLALADCEAPAADALSSLWLQVIASTGQETPGGPPSEQVQLPNDAAVALIASCPTKS